MSERNTVNTNIRLNLTREDDRRAWERLQQMNRKVYRSYTRAVVAALNDYFDRQEALADDPYLETRAKEDAFLQRVLETVQRGTREAAPIMLASSLAQALQSSTSVVPSMSAPAAPQNSAEDDQATMDFLSGF